MEQHIQVIESLIVLPSVDSFTLIVGEPCYPCIVRERELGVGERLRCFCTDDLYLITYSYQCGQLVVFAVAHLVFLEFLFSRLLTFNLTEDVLQPDGTLSVKYDLTYILKFTDFCTEFTIFPINKDSIKFTGVELVSVLHNCRGVCRCQFANSSVR